MTRLAITGHRGLSGATTRLVDEALRAEIKRHQNDSDNLVGLSCLADGADALFAQAVLDAGGELVAVIPAQRYREKLPEPYHTTYDNLLKQAKQIIELEHKKPCSEAYMDASIRMLQEANEVVAVWDGCPAAGHGGTADVVSYARGRGIPVTVLWPQGAQRK